MTDAGTHLRTTSRQPYRRAIGLCLLAGSALSSLTMFVGCEADSFFDPSVMGRWENTPTIVPILDRLASVEGAANAGIETSQIRGEDLIPEIEAYRVGPGDRIEITIQELLAQETPALIEREIDSRGMLEISSGGTISVQNLTVEQVSEKIAEALRTRQVLENARVSVVVRERRKNSFNIIGAVNNPGLFVIPKPDYRILEALSQAGRFSESATPTVYVIRQIPLSDAYSGRSSSSVNQNPAVPNENTGIIPLPMNPVPPPATTPVTTPNKTGVLDLIDDLSRPTNPTTPSTPPAAQPTTPPEAQPLMPRPSVTSPATTAGVTPSAVKAAPRLDLAEVQPGPVAVKTAGTSRPDAPNDWVFFDNRWVPVLRPSSMAPLASGADAGTDLVTQRVIEIPVQPLINGSARHNIVIRPGDIIRVPPLPEGVVYVGGQVARPGTYNLPATGKLTLHRAVVAAGGLNSTAIPERTEIIRMVGPDRQAIVRLNLRAIAEGTQPDLVLKPDDQINVGTNFWAFPLAVIRQGFRFSYGFGFILDRNFGTEIYGPQQTQGF